MIADTHTRVFPIYIAKANKTKALHVREDVDHWGWAASLGGIQAYTPSAVVNDVVTTIKKNISSARNKIVCNFPGER